jgi:hypothetical protein
MTDTQLDVGILAYLQRGVAASPRTDTAAVRAVASDHADSLLFQVEAIVAESLDVPIDWTKVTLGEAGRQVADVMRERHQELGQEALDALAWNFTFTWR